MESGSAQKVAILTLGCRTNQSESAIIEGTLKQNGVTIVDLKEKPDICVVNTCTVTLKGDHDSRQLIRKAAGTGARVIVTGCYSNLHANDVLKMSGVSQVVPNNAKLEIAGLISGNPTKPYYGNYSCSRPNLKVQDGCNFACTYCSVPAARGNSVSIALADAVRRAQLIESRGFREIVLTGIHLGSYGRDLPERSSLSRLVENILRNTAKTRIRLSSVEINEIDDVLIDLMQEERFCNHFHIPLQSGSDKILTRMRRNYHRSFFKERITEIASKVPNIAIGTDVIVGFPGEEWDDFRFTLDLIENLPISYIHAFSYSARENTPAAAMPEHIDAAVIKERMTEILTIGKKINRLYCDQQIGQTLSLIVEDKIVKGASIGTSSNFLKIAIDSSEYSRGSLVSVRVNNSVNDMLRGSVINSL